MSESKPSISKCGNHWTVEWNRRGDWYPGHQCVKTWAEALQIAEKVIRKGLHA